MVAPYSGAMLPSVARSATVSDAMPGPKNSTNLPTKGVLPLLWERHAHHPNLLPAVFATQEATPAGWVRKPLHSREGANIEIVTAQGQTIRSDGPYDDGPAILQAFHPLPVFEGNHALVGSWVIADQPAGIGMREDGHLITQNTSRFVPHAIIG